MSSKMKSTDYDFFTQLKSQSLQFLENVLSSSYHELNPLITSYAASVKIGLKYIGDQPNHIQVQNQCDENWQSLSIKIISVYLLSIQEISELILEKHIYNKDTITNALSFIRNIIDFPNIKIQQLFKYQKHLGLMFQNSKRLLLFIVIIEVCVPQLQLSMSDVYFENLLLSDESFASIRVISNQSEYLIKASKKKLGINPGIIVQVFKDKNKIQGYFIKQQYLSQTNRLNVDSQYSNGTQDYYISQSHSRSIKKLQIEDIQPDLKESLMYFLLAKLGLCPTFHLVINPYVLKGMYIATNDLNTDEHEYICMKSLQIIGYKQFQTIAKQKLQQ
ncbi:Hypothetical_protein [Hexamita inflata]|uniref:Hypothetical_protein n=1 Tax=Hexamita inflata TaxID=28002 RepID=A0AA86U8D9_9EUKA|nr:Hypothetical protein HINF_LOCUS34860 [Hexamita inflata]